MRHSWLGKMILTSLIALIVLAGCADKPTVKRIHSEPYHWEDQEVSLTDTVGYNFNISLSEKVGYWFGEGYPAILVITNRPAPQKGTQISIKGIVKLNYQIGVKTYTIVILENQRD